MQKNKFKLNDIDIAEFDGGFDCRIKNLQIDATYHVYDKPFNPRAKALLMDLDGTSVKSEEFWVWIIEKTVKKISKNPDFTLSEEDVPFVSGYTTMQHLDYCIKKYGLSCSLYDADNVYHEIAGYELKEILEGRGNVSAFKPRENLKDFLLEVKNLGIKIGLVTSGLDYKAIPEIVSAFKVLNMGEPTEFYDAIITGGKRKVQGQYGTLGELAVKPHPWIYAEIGVSLGGEESDKIIALEDSSSGVISARTAGYNVIGFNDGNLYKSGTDKLCYGMVETFSDVLKIIR